MEGWIRHGERGIGREEEEHTDHASEVFGTIAVARALAFPLRVFA
jgi:hypothetical protein